MLKIGDFSKLSRISIRMLRHYDEIGLLKPDGADPHVIFKTVAPIEYASATCQGGYDQIYAANQAVADWVCNNGYEFNGGSFCIYHVSPAQTSNPDELVTEVCFPVRRK